MDKLEQIRRQIDTIDSEIIRLLVSRVALCLGAEEVKFLAGQPVRQPAREARHMAAIRGRAQSLGLAPEFAEFIFRLIVDFSLNIQENRRAQRERGDV